MLNIYVKVKILNFILVLLKVVLKFFFSGEVFPKTKSSR